VKRLKTEWVAKILMAYLFNSFPHKRKIVFNKNGIHVLKDK